MNPWNIYESRTQNKVSRRDTILQREKSYLSRKIPNSLSYHSLTIDGESRNMAVINSDNLNIKRLCTMPGEDLPNGGLVRWSDNYWIIIERDPNNEVYTRGIMKQCNYLLRWIDNGEIIERWCIVEDGTKYLTGEYGDRNYIVTRGDSRVSVTLPRDKYTVRLGRDNRFLIDDPDAGTILAYRLTKPFKVGGVYNGTGAMIFVLAECNTEDTDNFEKMVANYYDYFPKDIQEDVVEDVTEGEEQDRDPADEQGESQGMSGGRKGWL